MSSFKGLAPAGSGKSGAWQGVAARGFLAGGGYFAAALFGILLSREPQGIASIWIANALALAWLLPVPRRGWPRLLAAVFAGGLAANLLLGQTPAMSVILMAGNVLEIGLGAHLVRRWVGPLAPGALTIASYLRLQAVAAIAAPAVAGLATAVLAKAVAGWPVKDLWWIWWSGSAIGAITILPLALTADRRAMQELGGRRKLAAFAAFTLLSTVFAYGAMATLSHPFVAVALPLVLAALWTTPFATALILVACMTVITVAAYAGDVASTGGALTASNIAIDISINFFAALTIFPAFCISLIVAELRREKARITASELHFRRVMEHSPIGMALVALDGRWQRINRALSDMLGYSPEELETFSFQDVTHPHDLAADLDLLKKTIDGEIDSYRMEKRYFRKDGSLVWALIAVSLVRDEETGRPLHLISQAEDITARKNAEAALEASESRWAFALESAGHGVWDHDIRTNTSFYSSVWTEMFGYTREEFGNAGDAWERLIHPDDMERVAKADRDHIAGLTPYFESEFRMRHRDGHYLWILDRGKVIERDAEGRALRMIGIHTDITAQKNTEAALAASESRWQFAFESARQGVWDYDARTGKTFYSSAWKAILGYDDLEIESDRDAWWEFVHPDDIPSARAAVVEHIARNTPNFECEFRMRHKDGHWVWILDRGKIIERDAEGRPLRSIGTHTDITARKETEERLKRLSERVRLAVQAGGVGLWELNPETNEVWWDDRMCAIYGIDPPRFERSHVAWIDCVHPDDRARADAEVWDAVAERRPYDTEFRIVLPSGEVRHVRSLANLIKRPDGKPALLIGTNWDITENRRLTDALSKEKELLRVTLESIGDAVVATDTKTRITFMNAVAEELTGWATADAMGRPVDEVIRVVDEASSVPLRGQVADCIASVQPLSRHEAVVLVGRTGDRRDIRESAAPVRTASGEVVGAVVVLQDMTRSRQLQRQLAHSAAHDALTGLPNRTAFDVELAAACASAVAERREHALCFIDLDRFKIVNDTVGHAAGDALLREIGRVIRQTVRASDLTARLGGDEFALILRDCTIEQAARVAENVIQAIRSIPFAWGGRLYDVGASVGVTAISVASLSSSELLSQADVACYAAKAEGRNRVAVYEAGESEAHRHHLDLLAAANIRGAIEQDRFRLFAQEIRALRPAGNGRHVELLLRLDDGGQLLDPAFFIPAAERYDLMSNIDRWVIRTALGRYGGRIRGESDLSISINLSANSLNDEGFWPFLQTELAETRFPPDRIHLEITETAFINNLAAAHALVSAAREAGCAIVLDDFGTGLSSFDYLKRFPVDFVKIDGTFMQNLDGNGVDRAIVESINDIAHKLGAKTVAECVETLETIEILRGMGVDAVQGYAISRPMPLDAFLAPERTASAA